MLLGELDDIFGTVVEDAQIELALPTSVRVEVLGRTGSEMRHGRILVPLGAVQNDVERVAVLKVTCPKARQNDEIAFELTASGRAVDDRARLETDAVRLRLTAADGAANKAQSRDIEIAVIVARTWSAHVVTTAARMNRDGAYEEAERYIERELRHFRRYVEGLDQGREMIRELELLARRVGRQFSSRMRKEMVVQSSLAMESRVDRRGMGKAAWSARMERGD